MIDSTEIEPAITGGVDTHRDVHVAAVVDSSTGRPLATASFPTTPAGYGALLEWVASHGRIDRVGVEGSNSYGAGLVRHLRSAGIEIIEVDRPDRQQRRRDGKTDTLDAQAAAVAVVSGRAQNPAKVAEGPTEAIRTVEVVCHSAVKDRTRATNQFHALLITAPAGLRESMRDLPLSRQLERARRFRASPDDVVEHHTRQALKALAMRIRFLDAQIAELETAMNELAAQASPALIGVYGVGPHSAARLLATVGAHPHRLTSEAQFAKLCGACPIPASSGNTTRHRLNRGGDRRANRALHAIALVRLQYDPRTREYAKRRRQEGLSRKDIIRCLKRFIAREIYHALTNPPRTIPGHELRNLRTTKNITLTATATALGRTPNDISRLERGLTHNTNLAHQQHQWLTQQPD